MSARPNDADLVAADPVFDTFERVSSRVKEARAAVGRVILGQEAVVDETMTGILAGGHVLLLGVPGLGKTRLVETLGMVLGLDTRRVQFTPDLMPADILGSEVLEEGDSGRRGFRFIEGPVFCQLLMADEINRASPRTQSALLQAMQERRVTVAGRDRALPQPFHVLATQNPLEQEGTYPLPEAQLDRFVMEVVVPHPGRDDERRIIIATTGAAEAPPQRVLDGETLLEVQKLVRRMPVGDSVIDAILALIRSGRPESTEIDEIKRVVAWGPGPRAGQALMLGVRARALIDGRPAPSVEDVMALAHPVLRHRMALHFAAHAEGIRVEDVIERMCKAIG